VTRVLRITAVVGLHRKRRRHPTVRCHARSCCAGGRDPEVPGRAPFYILRPEAAESLFILHQLTGNPIYREWG